jgi:hypothetical protein
MSPSTSTATLATIKHLYLYPIKAMRGVAVPEAYVGLNGMLGDRRYAFVQQALAGKHHFPWMTGRDKPRMILYSPQFARHPTVDDADPPIIVHTPDGDEYDVADERLRAKLESEAQRPLLLFKSKRGNYDAQHLSLFNLLTLRQLEMESDCTIDYRQFRANIYIEPTDGMPFTEEAWVGLTLQVGEAVISVTMKDERCMMINLDPETAQQNPQVLRAVARNHDECVGVYANVLKAGVVRVGDMIRVVSRER